MGISIKKIGRQTSNWFKKADSTANNVFQKVGYGFKQAGGVITNVSNRVGSALEAAAPVIGALGAVYTGDPLVGADMAMQGQALGGAVKQTGGNLGTIMKTNTSQGGGLANAITSGTARAQQLGSLASQYGNNVRAGFSSQAQAPRDKRKKTFFFTIRLP